MLNLIYLKYFCDAVAHGSISLSAKENFVSQSAISQGITKLEAALGKELITHNQNRFKPTEEGKAIYEKGKEIFKSISELEESLENEEGVYTGRIDFACTHSFALALLPHRLKQIKQLWPKLKVNFRLGHTDLIKEWIRKGMIDFGIVLDNEDLSSFDCKEIWKGEYRLYTADDEKLPFILSEERREINLLKASYLKKYKKGLPILMEVSSWEVIARLVEEGIGIGFFPDYVASDKQLKLCSFKLDPIEYKIYAIFPQAKKLHRNIEMFISSFLQML